MKLLPVALLAVYNDHPDIPNIIEAFQCELPVNTLTAGGLAGTCTCNMLQRWLVGGGRRLPFSCCALPAHDRAAATI